MTILRRHHNSNFTIIPNAVLDDERLSIEDKGVLCYMLSRPPDWQVRLPQIAKHLNIGRDKCARIFRKLSDADYVKRVQKRNAGRWAATDYIVRDEPRQVDFLSNDATDVGAVRSVYTDARHELWGEGIPILESLGVRQARPLIGRWLRDTHDDCPTRPGRDPAGAGETGR
jgi:hypothetical protein